MRQEGFRPSYAIIDSSLVDHNGTEAINCNLSDAKISLSKYVTLDYR